MIAFPQVPTNLDDWVLVALFSAGLSRRWRGCLAQNFEHNANIAPFINTVHEIKMKNLGWFSLMCFPWLGEIACSNTYYLWPITKEFKIGSVIPPCREIYCLLCFSFPFGDLSHRNMHYKIFIFSKLPSSLTWLEFMAVESFSMTKG